MSLGKGWIKLQQGMAQIHSSLYPKLLFVGEFVQERGTHKKLTEVKSSLVLELSIWSGLRITVLSGIHSNCRLPAKFGLRKYKFLIKKLFS